MGRVPLKLHERLWMAGGRRDNYDRLARRLFPKARAGHLATRVGAGAVNGRDRHFWATLDADSVRPYLPAVPVLLPLASFQRRDYQLRHPPRLPRDDVQVAVDTGAFAWFRSFTDYHFSAEQYADWIAAVHPPVAWAVIPDRPTEDLADSRAVHTAQLQTSDAIYCVLSSFLDVPWSWTPVLQGRTIQDYLRHVIDLADVLYALADVYRERCQPFRVGIGSICRRAQVPEIRRIVAAIATTIPGIPLHLFGAKLEVLKGWGNRPCSVISCDSAAWNGRFGAGIERFDAARKTSGLSQRQYALRVMLPRYAARVEATFGQEILPLESDDAEFEGA